MIWIEKGLVIDEELVDLLHSLSGEHICNLATILELRETHSPESICESVRWLYHSKTRELVKDTYKSKIWCDGPPWQTNNVSKA